MKELTIQEIFYFYGQIVGMTNEAIKVQTKALADLLELPPVNRIGGTLR